MSLVPDMSLWPQQAGIPRRKYGGIQGGKEDVLAFEPLLFFYVHYNFYWRIGYISMYRNAISGYLPQIGNLFR